MLQISTDKGELAVRGGLAEMVDFSLACSGERFSYAENFIEIARWGHFSAGSIAWEKFELM